MLFRTGWNTLDELRDAALAVGCTQGQFENAVKTVGHDPHGVANYLQRYALHWQGSSVKERERRAV